MRGNGISICLLVKIRDPEQCQDAGLGGGVSDIQSRIFDEFGWDLRDCSSLTPEIS